MCFSHSAVASAPRTGLGKREHSGRGICCGDATSVEASICVELTSSNDGGWMIEKLGFGVFGETPSLLTNAGISGLRPVTTCWKREGGGVRKSFSVNAFGGTGPALGSKAL